VRPNIKSSYYWDVLTAIELGYFEAENLALKVVNNDTPIQSTQFLATGACHSHFGRRQRARASSSSAPRMTAKL
jgi:hypothetical protein